MIGGTRDPWRWAVPALLVLNIAVKLPGLGLNELAGDEPFTVYWAQRPFSELASMLRTENNPPLYFLVMHGWSALVPLDAGWLRLPSALFSILTVWPLYLIGKRLFGAVAGLTAALLFTFSGHGLAFAHEVRAYALLALACTWSVWQLVRMANGSEALRSARDRSILWLVIANAVATWAHYFGWIMVGLELVMVFAVPMLRPVRMKMLAAAALTAGLSLPLAGTLFARAGSSMGDGTWVSVPAWDEPYSMVVRWSNAPVVAVLFLALLLLAGLRRQGKHAAIPLLWCAIPLLGMFVVSFRFPMYIDRYLYFASIGFYLLVAAAAGSPWPGRTTGRVIAAGCVVAMACTFTPGKGSGLHPSHVAARVKAWQHEGTAVVIQPGWYDLTYAWAVDPKLFQGAVPLEIALHQRNVFPVRAGEWPALDSSITTVVHIDAWAALSDPGHRVLDELRARYVRTDSVEADRKVIVRRFQAR